SNGCLRVAEKCECREMVRRAGNGLRVRIDPAVPKGLPCAVPSIYDKRRLVDIDDIIRAVREREGYGFLERFDDLERIGDRVQLVRVRAYRCAPGRLAR